MTQPLTHSVPAVIPRRASSRDTPHAIALAELRDAYEAWLNRETTEIEFGDAVGNYLNTVEP